MDTAHALTENLAALLRREHDALTEFLVALADFDRHRVWAELGHPSLFYFLHRELHLSKGAAQYRKVAAELIQQVPAVVEPLRRGELCLTSIIEAAKVVTADNWETVLPRFYGLSKRDAMEVVAALQPHPAPPVRTIITVARPSASRAASTGVLALDLTPEQARNAGAPVESGWPDEPAQAPCPAPAPRPAELVPLSAELGRLHVTISKRFARKLEEARSARPDATDEELLEAGLDLLLTQVAKRRGLVERPRQKPGPRSPSTSRPTFAARPGSGTAAAASGNWRTARSAAAPAISSSTTSSRWRWAGPPPSTTSGSSAGPITSRRRASCSGTGG